MMITAEIKRVDNGYIVTFWDEENDTAIGTSIGTFVARNAYDVTDLLNSNMPVNDA